MIIVNENVLKGFIYNSIESSYDCIIMLFILN
jgi:hypothetical protein